MSRSGHLGALYGFDIPVCHAMGEAMLAGARTVNPEASLTVTAVGDWGDVSAAKEAGLAQVDTAGVDYWIGCGEGPTLGSIEAAKARGGYATGYVGDMSELGPETVLASIVWDMTPIFDRLIEQTAAGSFQGEFIRYGVKEGALDIAVNSESQREVPDAAVAAIMQARAAIRRARSRCHSSPSSGRRSANRGVSAPLVELRGITKRFPGGTLANDAIDLELRQGEILALLGENGAGKSTLMSILYGLYRPDDGEIRLRGQAVRFRSAHDAIRHGLGMVHQDFMLVPTLTVAENLMLGQPSPRALLEDRRAVAARITELALRHGLAVDPLARIDSLSVGQQQRVEILKALYRGAADPRRADRGAHPQEVDELLAVLRGP